MQTDGAAEKIGALLKAQPSAAGVRLSMVNDWGSHTGFSYTISFMRAGEELADDERIELSSGATLFVDRKALWAGEGGLLGAQLDMDDAFNLKISTKDESTS